MKIKQW